MEPGDFMNHLAPPRAARRPRERGFVLVLAMLILLVLSGMGIYGMRTSRIELRTASNMRLGASAEYVAEAAMQRALTQILADPSRYLGFLTGGASYNLPTSPGMFNEMSTNYDSFGLQKGLM